MLAKTRPANAERTASLNSQPRARRLGVAAHCVARKRRIQPATRSRSLAAVREAVAASASCVLNRVPRRCSMMAWTYWGSYSGWAWKRHILVDTLGLPLKVVVHSASIQDRDGALLVLQAVRRVFPFIERIFADGGHG